MKYISPSPYILCAAILGVCYVKKRGGRYVKKEGSLCKKSVFSAQSAEEKISLSDRFGLWLGFHNCDQETYFEIIDAYAKEFDLKIDLHQLRAEALEWSAARGARSGRVAWQFIQNLAGRLEKRTS